MTQSLWRTIVLQAEPATPGLLMPRAPLRWPETHSGASLGYAIDATAPLTDAGDTIGIATVDIAPFGAGELAAAELAVAGAVVSMVLSGGIPNRDYTVRIAAQTLGGLTFTWEPKLLVRGNAHCCAPAPVSRGFGPPISASAALPLMLSLAQPLSTSLAATLL